MILIPLGGAVSRMDRTSMALSIPDARWFYFCLPMWWDPAGKDQHVAEGRAFMRALRPWSVRPAPPTSSPATKEPGNRPPTVRINTSAWWP